jgi:cyanate permease
MKRSLRFCEVGAALGAAAATTGAAAALPLLLFDLLSAFADDLEGALAFDDGFALALLVCLGLAALLVRAPAGASTKLVSRTARASFGAIFVFIIVVCLPD